MYLRSHEAQHEQVDAGGDYGQAKEDEDQTQDDVSRFIGERLVVLHNNLSESFLRFFFFFFFLALDQ